MQSADWTSNYFASLIRNLLTVFALTLAPCSWVIIGARQRLGKGRTQHRVAIFPGGNMSCLITFIITSTSNANGGTAKNRIEGLRNVVPLDHLNELLHLCNSKKLRLIIIK